MTAPAPIVGVGRPTWRVHRDVLDRMMHRPRRILIGLGAALVLLAIFLLVIIAIGVGEPPPAPGMAVLALVAGLVGLFLADGIALLSWRLSTAAGPLEERYTITPDHVEFESAQGTTRLLATAVTRVRTTPDFWLMWTTPLTAVAICRDGFDPADAAAVDALLAGYGRR